MKDVPVQYKRAVDNNVRKTIKAAECLMAIAEEIGDDNIELSSDRIIIKIDKKKKI